MCRQQVRKESWQRSVAQNIVDDQPERKRNEQGQRQREEAQSRDDNQWSRRSTRLSKDSPQQRESLCYYRKHLRETPALTIPDVLSCGKRKTRLLVTIRGLKPVRTFTAVSRAIPCTTCNKSQDYARRVLLS